MGNIMIIKQCIYCRTSISIPLDNWQSNLKSGIQFKSYDMILVDGCGFPSKKDRDGLYINCPICDHKIWFTEPQIKWRDE